MNGLESQLLSYVSNSKENKLWDYPNHPILSTYKDMIPDNDES
jgi:hypothetical protein